jgi:hypothetical protein
MVENNAVLYTRSELSNMQPIASIKSLNFDIPHQIFSLGFPGFPELQTWFQIKYDGFIRISEAGQYAFKVFADEFSKLRIYDNNNQEILYFESGNSFPLHESDPVQLEKNVYRFELDYFQGWPQHLGLQLYWKEPDVEEYKIIPKDNFIENNSN